MGKWRIITEEFFKALGMSFPVAAALVAWMLWDPVPREVPPERALDLARGVLGMTALLSMVFASILHGLSPTVNRLLDPRHDEPVQKQEDDHRGAD